MQRIMQRSSNTTRPPHWQSGRNCNMMPALKCIIPAPPPTHTRYFLVFSAAFFWSMVSLMRCSVRSFFTSSITAASARSCLQAVNKWSHSHPLCTCTCDPPVPDRADTRGALHLFNNPMPVCEHQRSFNRLHAASNLMCQAARRVNYHKVGLHLHEHGPASHRSLGWSSLVFFFGAEGLSLAGPGAPGAGLGVLGLAAAVGGASKQGSADTVTSKK